MLPLDDQASAEQPALPDIPISRILMAAPPSANHLFLAVPSGGRRSDRQRRVKSAAYRSWLRGGIVWLLRDPRIDAAAEAVDRTARYSVIIRATIDRRRDLDNIVKPVIDRLVRLRQLVDDRYVDDLLVARAAYLRAAYLEDDVANRNMVTAEVWLRAWKQKPRGST